MRTALDFGYRHIDTAAAYQNEKGVGRGQFGRRGYGDTTDPWYWKSDDVDPNW